MLNAHKQWATAVGVQIHRLVHEHASDFGITGDGEGALRRHTATSLAAAAASSEISAFLRCIFFNQIV